MPNIKSAKKKMKQDIARRAQNRKYEGAIESVMKSIKKGTKTKKDEVLKKAYSVIDKAAKKRVIHSNKASRLKGRVSRLVKAK